LEIRTLKSKLRENKGSIFPLTLAVMLSLFIIMAGSMEYFRLKIIASGIKDAIQSSVISVSVQNFENVYSSTREGYSGAYKYNDSYDDWKEEIDIGDVYHELSNLLGLDKEGNYYIKRTESEYEYKLSNLDVQIINSPLKSNNPNKKFIAESFINLEVPLSFGWEHLPPMKIRLKVRSEYMARF